MKKIFTFLALTLLIGSASIAQGNRHGEYRDQAPTFQQDNSRGYSNQSQNRNGYQNNDQSYRQDRGNDGYNERRYDNREYDRGFHNDRRMYDHERMEMERYRRNQEHAWFSIRFGKRWH